MDMPLRMSDLVVLIKSSTIQCVMFSSSLERSRWFVPISSKLWVTISNFVGEPMLPGPVLLPLVPVLLT